MEPKDRQHRRKLARWCRAELERLDVHPPLDFEQLRQAIEKRRGKPLKFVAYPLRTDVFGLWLSYDEDWILYQSATIPPHQRTILLHELGHVLLEHTSDEVDREALQTIFPAVPASFIQAVLRRSCYDDAHEHEAEVFADMIGQWDQRVMRVAPPSDATVREFDKALLGELAIR